jgi:hypothetical protein
MPGGIPRRKPFNVDLQSFLEDEDEMGMDELADMVSEQAEDEEIGFLAPSEQAIMVGCWLAMKEVSHHHWSSIIFFALSLRCEF